METVRKVSFLAFNLLVFSFIASIYVAGGNGYRTNVYSYLPVWSWMLLSGAILTNAAVIYYSEGSRIWIFTAVVTTVILVFLPSWLVDGTVYGPDSYVKAATAKRILHSNDALIQSIYPGMSVFSAMSKVITGLRIWVPMLLASSLLAPLAARSLARRWFSGLKSQRSALVFASVLLPLGIGTWISTVSIYHSYHLSYPLAVLYLAVTYAYYRTRRRAFGAISLLLGISTALFHPLLLISSFALFSVYMLSRTSVRARSFARLLRGQIHSKELFFLFTIGLPVFVPVLYFQIVPNFGTSVLIMIGLLSRASLAAGATEGEKVCVEAASTPFTCGPLPSLGQFFYLLLLLALATGLVGVKTLTDVREIVFERRLPSSLAPTGLYLAFVLGLFVMLFGSILAQIMVRIVGVLSVGTFLILMWFQESPAERLRPDKRTIPVFVIGIAGLPLVALLVPALETYVLLIAFVSGLSLLVGTIAYLKPEVAPQVTVAIFVIVLSVSVPILYPAPSINDKANHGGTLAEQQQVKWFNQHGGGGFFASRMRLWGMHTYIFPAETIRPYRGSYWLLSSITLSENEQQQRIVVSLEGERVNPNRMEYVLLSGLSDDYVPIVYTKDGRTYERSDDVTEKEVQAVYPRSSKIYSATNETSIYKT